jgi:hypothetical protein
MLMMRPVQRLPFETGAVSISDSFAAGLVLIYYSKTHTFDASFSSLSHKKSCDIAVNLPSEELTIKRLKLSPFATHDFEMNNWCSHRSRFCT